MSKGQVIAEAAVQFERLLPAAPEKAWAFLTEPSRVAEWYGEGVIEPREGGKVELMGGHIRGVVTGWRPNQFFAHTWNVLAPEETVSGWPVSYLEFALTPEGNAAKLTLTHRPIMTRMQPQTMMGWHTFLDMLDAGIKGEAIGPRGNYMQKNAALYGVDLNNLER
jgi:uncharacterized protein YndB with AHSA1/START domain